jgi:glycosyltransferase involved in cell wall biosynthesis
MRDRLSILYVSPMPPSPPRFGAQARMHGLMTSLARRHDVTAVSLVDHEFDVEDCRRAMQAYCRDVILVPNPYGRNGAIKRALQLRSLASLHSFERHRCSVPALQRALDHVLSAERFDVVNLEFPYLAHFRFDRAPAGTRPPPRVIDTHEIAYDIVRQFARRGRGFGRSVYAALNWRKLRREELSAFRRADAICACSVADEERILAEVPAARTVVVPNAADVEYYQPRPQDPRGDGRTVVFFGLLSTLPNIDGATWFIREIWPRIVAARPDARCKIIGKGATRAVLDLARPGVEMVGFVEDLRPHLASAAALVVPLRLGGGTRLKIVEGMAMGKAIVSTTLGAEGIDVSHGRDIVIADDGDAFAESVVRVLNEPGFATELGAAARRLAVERYAWSSAASKLEELYRGLLAERPGGRAGTGAPSTERRAS